MAEGTPENQITYFTVQGHSHDGENSTKIDFSGYDIYDFISEGDLSRVILSVVNSGPLNPRGGIVISDPDGGSISLSPDVPNDASGLSSTCTINEDGATIRQVTWDPDEKAASYIIQLHRSIDGGSNYIKIEEITTTVTSHAFEATPMANVTQTRYKLIVQNKSAAGILGTSQEISNIQPCVSTSVPAGPKFEDSSSSPTIPNLFTMFRGFMARMQEQTESDVKWGIGEFEYSVSKSLASEGQWNHADNLVADGRQTSRIISVSGLDTNTSYYLRVRAISNSNVVSPWTYWNGLGDDGDATMTNADTIVPTEITGTEITDNSIKTINIDALQITAELIGSDAVIARTIEARAISASKLETDFALVGNTIKSNSYTAGSVGWMIDHGGTAEFNGAVTVRNLDILSDPTVSPASSSSLTITDATGTVFKVAGDGDVISKGNLTLGAWTSGSGQGLNWNKSTNVLTIRGSIIIENAAAVRTTLGVEDGAEANDSAQDNPSTYTFSPDGSGSTFQLAATPGSGTGGLYIGSDKLGYWNGSAWKTYMQSNGNFYLAGSGTNALSWDGSALTITGTLEGSTIRTISTSTTPRVVINPTSYSGEDHAFMWFETNLEHANSNYDGGPVGSTRDVEWYPGFIIGTHDKTGSYSSGLYDNIRYRGQMALMAPKFSASFAPAGILIESYGKISETYNGLHDPLHPDDGQEGYIKFGTTQNTDILWIMDYGIVDSATTVPQTIILKGGLKIQGAANQANAVYSTSDTLYNINGTLHWDGSPVGGSSGTVTSVATSGAITGGTITTTGTIGFNEAAIGGIGHSHSGAFLSGSITFAAGNTINSSSAGGLILQGSAGNSGNLRANNGSSKGIEVQSGGSTKIYHSTTAVWQTSTDYISSYQQLRGLNGSSSAPAYSFTGSTQTGMSQASNSLTFHGAGTLRFQMLSYAIAPGDNDAFDSGSSSYKWDDVWATNGNIATSDVANKTDIMDSVLGLDFIKGLRPVSYKWAATNGRAGVRDHHGFIGQEVETLLGSDAATTALWINAHIEPMTAEENPAGEIIEERYEQGLRYTEFVPILTKAIQELEARVAALEA